jgi:hypothetical protein
MIVGMLSSKPKRVLQTTEPGYQTKLKKAGTAPNLRRNRVPKRHKHGKLRSRPSASRIKAEHGVLNEKN